MCHMMTFLYHYCTATVYYNLKGRTKIVKGAILATRLVPGRTNLVAVLVPRGGIWVGRANSGCDRY